MTRRQRTHDPTGPNDYTGVEWIGGTISMPAHVTGEGQPYRPEVLIWMGADGAILGSTGVKPGELLPIASESLRSTIEQPMHGRPHRPTRVRVASAELADVLRAGHPGLDVVCAPAPELNGVLTSMRENLGEDAATEPSFLPSEIEPDTMSSSHDILADLAALTRDDDEVDPAARAVLEDELVGRFAASPEAKGLEDINACRFVMDLAADYFRQTIATLSASELHDVLFELIPRKVSIAASEARWIVEAARAFYTFLKREFGLEQADSCLGVLGANAVEKLEAALSDSRNFGTAKSLFMAGSEAGFDMRSREGIEAWMQSIQGKPLPSSIAIPSLGAPPPSFKKAAKAKKHKRKAARKARRKNR